MVDSIPANGYRTRCTEMERIPGQMGADTKVNIGMTTKKEKEDLNGMMDASMRVAGNWANKTALVI